MSNPSKLFLGGELSPGAQRRFLILVCFVMSAVAWVSAINFVRTAVDEYVNRRVEVAVAIRERQFDRTVTDIMGRLVSVERRLSEVVQGAAQRVAE